MPIKREEPDEQCLPENGGPPQWQKEYGSLKDGFAALKGAILELGAQLSKGGEVGGLLEGLSRVEAELKKFETKSREVFGEKNELQRRLVRAEEVMSEMVLNWRNRYKQKEQEMVRVSVEVRELHEIVTQLISFADSMILSRRWRLGHFLLSLRYWLLFKSVPSTSKNAIDRVRVRYEALRSSTREGFGVSGNPGGQNQVDSYGQKVNFNCPEVHFQKVSGVHDLNVLFVLPVSGNGGGVHSVVQEAYGMNELGIRARVAVRQRDFWKYIGSYSSLEGCDKLFLSFSSSKELSLHAKNFKVIVATHFISVELVWEVVKSCSGIMPAYYIQDYEPFLVEDDPVLKEKALNSYNLIPGCINFAKTEWLISLVGQHHKVPVFKVSPSLDHNVYYSNLALRRLRKNLTISAMIRPSTPRRNPVGTFNVLRQLKQEYGDKIDIQIFGVDDEDVRFRPYERDFDFKNQGVLSREGVAEVLRHSDIFLDLSVYQAFGRTGLEAMACGAAAVLPVKGGTHEYAVDGRNCLLVDTEDEKIILIKVKKLIEDIDFRSRLQMEALETASKYSIRGAVISELRLFWERLNICRNSTRGKI